MSYLGLSIGHGTDSKLGEYSVNYNGANKEVTINVYKGFDKGWIIYSTGIFPTSRADAMEQLLEMQASGAKVLSGMTLYGSVAERRAEEQEMLQLRDQSQRWADFAGTPTVDELIAILQQIKQDVPDCGDWRCFCTGCEFYIHLDAETKAVIFDEELLWEEYETPEYWQQYF